MGEFGFRASSKEEVFQVLGDLIDATGGKVKIAEVTAGANIAITLKLPVSSNPEDQKELANSLLAAVAFIMSKEV